MTRTKQLLALPKQVLVGKVLELETVEGLTKAIVSRLKDRPFFILTYLENPKDTTTSSFFGIQGNYIDTMKVVVSMLRTVREHFKINNEQLLDIVKTGLEENSG